MGNRKKVSVIEESALVKEIFRRLQLSVVSQLKTEQDELIKELHDEDRTPEAKEITRHDQKQLGIDLAKARRARSSYELSLILSNRSWDFDSFFIVLEEAICTKLVPPEDWDT